MFLCNISDGASNHSFEVQAKFSEKLTFLTPSCEHVRVHIRGGNLSFSENLAYALNETYLSQHPVATYNNLRFSRYKRSPKQQ